MIENFRLAYGCMTTELADGRQAFEVPSALALAGGAAAAAFGAGPDVAIATGATSALFAQGKAYYDPRARGHVVASALDAVICIKREASGISSKVAAGDAARTARFGAALSGSVDVPPQFQYYQMVTSSLHDVHSILTDRLQAVGKFSPSALADEISALAKKQQAAESPANQQSTHAQFSSLGFTAQNGLAAVVEGSIALDALAPKLELCVVRAKSG